MEDRMLGTLDCCFRSRMKASEKLFLLGRHATPTDEGSFPAWSRWQASIASRQHATFAREIAGLLHAEVKRRGEAAREVAQLRRNSLTPEDAKALADGELSLIRMILVGGLETSDSRWQLLASVCTLRSPVLRSSTWRKWPRIVNMPEAIRSAAIEVLEAEAVRRGLVKVVEVAPIGEATDSLLRSPDTKRSPKKRHL